MPKIQEPEIKKPSRPASSGKSPQLLKGFRDILPPDQPYWRFVRKMAESFATGYGFEEIGLPILEETNLFVRSIGKQTDIVEKEMFSFVDKNDGNVSLRPEFTASVARSYINHGMINLPQPVKLYYFGPAFRREKPQGGRQRQFHQFGLEVIGDSSPILDAQLIAIAYNFFSQINLPDVSVQVNSIGSPESRKVYKQELVNYYRAKRKILCEDCKKRLTKNPLRLLDCKVESCQSLKAEAPQIVDWLDEESKDHFMKVIGYLDEIDIPYVLNPYLVRGLDYYTKTVFEIWPAEADSGSQSALLGGGRYDGLIEYLGGRPTPAAGFSAGVERIISYLKEKATAIPPEPLAKIFLAQIGDQAKVKALALFEQMRRENISVAENFTKDSLKSQLEIANKLKIRYVLILGQKEVVDGTVLIRDMESGIQEIIDFNKTVTEMKKKLANN